MLIYNMLSFETYGLKQISKCKMQVELFVLNVHFFVLSSYQIILMHDHGLFRI